MEPTTAADSMLVISSITSSLDWMLTRDSTGSRNSLRLRAGSVVTSESGSSTSAHHHCGLYSKAAWVSFPQLIAAGED